MNYTKKGWGRIYLQLQFYKTSDSWRFEGEVFVSEKKDIKWYNYD